MSRPTPEMLRSEINELIGEFLTERTSVTSKRSERMRPILDIATQYVLGDGKRLRPQLFCWGYWGAGGTDDAIKKTSVSIELIHAFLLIHDDIIDRDEMRRGEPTVHVKYSGLAGERPDAHLGMSLAIIAGDIMYSYGHSILIQSPFPAEFRLKAAARMDQLLDEVITGECLDMLSSYLGDGMSEQDIVDIALYKTAAYTVDGPLHLGGILAGASADLLASYTEYAFPIGVAFQLRDDVLGIFGDSKETGKSASSDLHEGKRTLLIHEALKMASDSEAEYLRTWLGNPSLGRDETERMRSIIRESGALAEVEARIERLYGQAQAALGRSPLDDESRLFLSRLADGMAHRTK